VGGEKLKYGGLLGVLDTPMSFSLFPQSSTWPKTRQFNVCGRIWEVQEEDYTCGPVAIINALHHFGRCVGTATRRSIIQRLNTMPKHMDGFRGTRPDDFNVGLKRYFSDGGEKRICRYIGGEDCRRILDNKNCKAFIILFAWMNSRGDYAYHYIFGWRDKNNYIITLNDGRDSEVISIVEWAKSAYCFEMMDKQGFVYPQMWAFY
jgi:hypothetical protein